MNVFLPTENLVSEGGQDPWKTSVGELVLLNIEDLRQSSSEHGGSEDLKPGLVNVLYGGLLG